MAPPSLLSGRRLKELYSLWKAGAIDYQRYSEEVFSIINPYIKNMVKKYPARVDKQDAYQEAITTLLSMLPDYDPHSGTLIGFIETPIKLTLAKLHGASAYVLPIEVGALRKYRAYKRKREAGANHDSAIASVRGKNGALSPSLINQVASIVEAHLIENNLCTSSNGDPTALKQLLLSTLTKRELSVLSRRLFMDESWDDVSLALSLSKERIRQLYNQALLKLKKKLKEVR